MKTMLFALVLAATPAYAGPAPWAEGVTPEHKQTAQRLLDEGNARFVERDFTTALAKYREAIAAWNHPAIRFNVVRCLVHLEKPIEAAAELEQSLAYGAEPFEDAVYSEAIAYKKLLASQVGELVIDCKQPGVRLTLDGKVLGTCPHSQRLRIGVGTHQLVGTRPGFVARSLDIVVGSSKPLETKIELEAVDKIVRVEHRYRTWVPWTVTGAGFAVAGIGALITLRAAGEFDRYDESVATTCPTNGCSGDQLAALRTIEDGARFQNRLGVATIVAGAATVAVGGVLVFRNRGRTVYAGTVEPRSGGAMVSISGGFR